MDRRKLKQLMKTRKALKEKYKSLKSDIIQSQTQLEKSFKPITEPLQQLLKNIKNDTPVKKEYDIKKEHDIDEEISREKELSPKIIPENIFNEYLPTHSTFLEDTYTNINTSDEVNRTIHEQTDIARDYLQNLSQSIGYNEYLEEFDALPRMYIDEQIRDTEDKFDHQYGVIHDMETEKFNIGDSELFIVGKDVRVHNITYPGTIGLYELLFKKTPTTYKPNDLKNYMDILERTNTYRRNYNPKEQIQGTNSFKYLSIIKPYLLDKRILKDEKNRSKPEPITKIPATRARVLKTFQQGKGLVMKFSESPVEYIYFDDVNELVERLKLLIASQIAGNTNHNNEIVSIIEELRELEIIK